MKLFSKDQPPNDIRDALASLHQQDALSKIAAAGPGDLVALSDDEIEQSRSQPLPLDADEVGIEQAMQAMHEQAAAIETPPVYNAVTSSAWRTLEEQRAGAMDRVHECDAEIAKWTERRDDAQRAADGCAAGQKAMER
jgi:hypothetical protein